METNKQRPDFQTFHAAVTRQAVPDRIPTAEVGIDIEVMDAFLARPISDIKTYASFWEQAGYDYALLQVRGQPISDSFQVKIAEGQLALHGPEASVSTFLRADSLNTLLLSTSRVSIITPLFSAQQNQLSE